ncbi:MAG TPA: hypothetical protein VF006_19840 [Longimicrobium sp.]
MAPLFAACDSTVAPDLTDVQAYTCKIDANTGECAGTPTLGADRLVFGSPEELEVYLKPLQDAPREELEAAEARNGFQSLRAYLDSNEDTEEAAKASDGSEEPTGNEARALEQDGVTREDFPVSDAFLSVLNARGEVAVGGSVFKVTRDHVYEVSPDYAVTLDEKVPTLSSAPPADGDPRITVHKVESTLRDDAHEVAASQGAGPVFNHQPGVGGDCYVYGGSSYRMHGKSYISNFFFYAEAGVSTEWERKKSFLWWSYWSNTWQSGTLSHSFTSSVVFGMWNGPWFPIGPASGSQSQTGTSKIHRTVAWGVGFGVRLRGELHTRHNVANGYVTGSCFTDASA